MAVSLSTGSYLLLFSTLFNTVNHTDVHTCTYVMLHLAR